LVVTSRLPLRLAVRADLEEEPGAIGVKGDEPHLVHCHYRPREEKQSPVLYKEGNGDFWWHVSQMC
jgi:hypothetical protein